MATQAEIDALKLKMQNAKAAMDAAWSSMKLAHDKLSRCVCGRKGVGCGSGCSGPYNSDKFPELGEQATDSCAYQGTLGKSGKCCSDCCDVNTCESNRVSYNNAVSFYDNKLEQYEQAKEDYEIASGHKIDKEISKLEQEAKAIRTRYYVFGGIVLILIVAGIFIWMKYKK